MEILSAKAKEKALKKPNNLENLIKSQTSSTKKDFLSLRINTILHNTLRNYLVSMHNVSDYTFNSVSDILRHIITQIELKGLPNNVTTYDAPINEYIEVIVRVDTKLKQFWQTLPNRNRRKILEKAIISFSKGI